MVDKICELQGCSDEAAEIIMAEGEAKADYY
jgi:hypothetical protein